MFDVLLCVTLTPIINHLDNLIWHGYEGDCARLLNRTSIDVKDLVGPLRVPCGAKENSWESTEMHGICDCWVFMSLEVRAEGCNAVFGEVKLVSKDNFAGGVNF
jgi:hypothetical protein